MEFKAPHVPFEQLIIGARGRRKEHNTDASSERGISRGSALNIRWGARWKPPQNVTTKFRLLPGSYVSFEDFPLPYYSYVEHFVAGPDKSLICSKKYKYVDGELTTIGGKCLACDVREEGDSKNIGWRIMHAFNGIHLAWYHLVPVIDDVTKRPLRYERGRRKGEIIMDRIPCEGRRCKLCEDGVEKTFGRKVHWSIGNSHLEQLGGIIKEIGRECVCGGLLTELSYECPQCGRLLLQIDDPEEADCFGGARHKCPGCGTEEFPLKQLECDSCKDPTPVSIYDCNLEIKRTGEQTASTIQIPRWERAPLPPELEELATPWPFNKIFAGDPLDVQARVLKVRNPYTDSAQHAADYDEADEITY